MPSINEVHTTISTRGMRFNQKLLDICNKTGLSANSIFENCLVYFATLTDDQRIQFMAQTNPDKVDVSKIIEPSTENTIRDRALAAAKKNLGKTPFRTSEKMLVTVGLALLDASIEVAASKKQD